MELVAPAGPVYQAGTLSGNPLAMTAGLWSLQELSPKLYRHLAKLGTKLAAGLADAARAAGVPLQVNAFGSLVTPFFTSEAVTDFQSALKADTAAYGRFFHAMLDRGIYPPPSQFEAWFLSAAHTERDVAATIKPRARRCRSRRDLAQELSALRTVTKPGRPITEPRPSPAVCPSARGESCPPAASRPCPRSPRSCRRRR